MKKTTTASTLNSSTVINNDFMLEAVKTADSKLYNDIINNDNIDIEALNDSEKHAVLIYNAVNKALADNNNFYFDCNYASSKNVANKIYLVDYYRYIVNDACIQVYCKHLNSKSVSFNVYTSCKACYREALEKLNFINDRNKTFKRMNISLDDITSVLNSTAEAIRNNTASKQTASKQTASKQTASKQTASKQTASKQTASKQTASKQKKTA